MPAPNIVVLVLDDCGENLWGPNRTASFAGITPELDLTLSGGVYFSNCVGVPNCSPFRAQALTGRFGARTGMQSSINLPGPGTTYAQSGAQWQLQLGETTMAHGLATLGYKCGAFGKWHINSPANGTDWDAPRTIGGFHRYAGFPGNFNPAATGSNGTPNKMSLVYNAALPALERIGWGRILDNVLTPVGTPVPGDLVNGGGTLFTPGYAPTVNIDDAIVYVNANPNSPMFLWVAPQSPHTPVQWPPYALHSQTLNYPGGYSLAGPVLEGEFFSAVNPTHPIAVKPFVKASLQALDTEWGRLRAALGANTYYIIIGDNGTDGATEVGSDGSIIESPYDSTHGKNTLFEGGIRVPLAISGPNIVSPGRIADCPTQATDLYETVRQLAGLAHDNTKKHDSRALIPFLQNPDCHALFGITPSLRGQQVSAWVEPVVNPALYASTVFTWREYAAKVSGYKLIWNLVGAPSVKFYYLPDDPHEQTNLTPSGASGALSPTRKAHFDTCARIIRSYIQDLEHLPPPNIP